MKSALARLGIRGFKPHLRKAPERLAGLRTAEGTGLPANVIEEFRRDMARLALVREQSDPPPRNQGVSAHRRREQEHWGMGEVVEDVKVVVRLLARFLILEKNS